MPKLHVPKIDKTMPKLLENSAWHLNTDFSLIYNINEKSVRKHDRSLMYFQVFKSYVALCRYLFKSYAIMFYIFDIV